MPEAARKGDILFTLKSSEKEAWVGRKFNTDLCSDSSVQTDSRSQDPSSVNIVQRSSTVSQKMERETKCVEDIERDKHLEIIGRCRRAYAHEFALHDCALVALH